MCLEMKLEVVCYESSRVIFNEDFGVDERLLGKDGVCVKVLWRCVVWLLVRKHNVCVFMWNMYSMLQFCFAFILDMLGLGALRSLDKKYKERHKKNGEKKRVKKGVQWRKE